MIKTSGVLHFTIPVKDLDRSEKFYTEVMGLTKVRRNSHMVFMRDGSDYFVLTHSENPIEPNKAGKHDIHSAFKVTAEAYAEAKVFLASRGIGIFKEEDRRHGTFRGRSAYFNDPDGNVIEIMALSEPPISEMDEKGRS